MRALRLGAAVALAGALGCMTIDSQRDPGYQGPAVYSGVRKDMALMSSALSPGDLMYAIMFAGVDLPFSAIADTVLLPVTIAKDERRQEERSVDTQTASERPGPIAAIAGEEPLATAQRLFQTCAKLLHAQDPQLADCYSVDADVEINGGASLRGSEYKQTLRAGMARDAAAGHLVEWREPSFSADGAQVRIDATRASSSKPSRSPLVLRVGPCSDGAWRILNETSIGWAAR